MLRINRDMFSDFGLVALHWTPHQASRFCTLVFWVIRAAVGKHL